jgi:arabinoxylan arabinofuranohydrolase
VTLTEIHNEDWVGYSQVDFGDGASRLLARVAAAASRGGSIQVYVDGCDVFSNLPGERIGSCSVGETGGWQNWLDIQCEIELTAGLHDVYLRFSGTGEGPLFNLDFFQFE